MSALAFLRALFAPTDGYIDLRAIGTDKKVSQEFIPTDRPERINAFIKKHAGKNIYFGVAARRDTRNGTLENCANVRALWADLDFKDTPEPKAREAIAAFRLTPTIVVRTGGGLHCYWLLSQPYDLQNDSAPFKAHLRAIARSLSADMSAAEPARVLRVPGTFNVKYQPPPEVTIE